jgi:hypothetical protein
MVDMVMGWLPEIKQKLGIKTWLEWVGVIRSVTEGKVRLSYLSEVQNANLNVRSSLKHQGLELLWNLLFTTKVWPKSQLQIHPNLQSLCKQPQTSFKSSRSKHTRPWNYEKRSKFFWNKCEY